MRILQIDTIHVVARSPYLVLYSRLGDYRPEWLGEWLADGSIFECWAHEACFAPIEDYPCHRQHMQNRNGHWSMRIAHHTRRYYSKSLETLLEHVRTQGPVKASDFERPKGERGGGWWGWKTEKRSLEALFALGDLMITRRENFHRVYDLTERVLAKPAAVRGDGSGVPIAQEPLPDGAAQHRRFTLEAVHALGVTQARWVTDYFRDGRRLKDADLDPFVAAGDLVRVEVDGWPTPGYVHRDHAVVAARAAAGKLRATHTTLLSPFDPVVWDRERAAAMFAFDYRIECYVPEPKRFYGYYVLPILHDGRLVGRLDAKAHRADGVFEIKTLYLEPTETPNRELAAALTPAIRACAKWHATPTVTIGRTTPRPFARVLRAALAAGA